MLQPQATDRLERHYTNLASDPAVSVINTWLAYYTFKSLT